MSLGSAPKMPDPPNPAKRPDRREAIDPEDIAIGDSDNAETSTRKGRRALRRPVGSSDDSGVGTGLSV